MSAKLSHCGINVYKLLKF